MVETSALKRVCRLIGLLLMLAMPQQMNAQTPSLATGIEGIASIGPIHGGPSQAGVDDSAPLAKAAFEVVAEAGVYTSFTTHKPPHFQVPLNPPHPPIQ